jgi:hypothetical protein
MNEKSMTGQKALAAQLRELKSGVFGERDTPEECVQWMESAITADSGYRPAAITFGMMLLNTALEKLAKASEAGELGQ